MSFPAVIGMFCEDVRLEQSGQNTLVGILPDNARIEIPGTLPKLGVYVRVHLDVSAPVPEKVTARLETPDGQNLPLPGWDHKVMQNGFDVAKTNGNPTMGLLLRTVISPFPVPNPGMAKTIITIDGKDYLAAIIHFTEIPATASPQPSAQSQPGASKS